MAKVYLDQNESNSFNGNVDVFGNTGIEGVLIRGANNTIRSTVERVEFSDTLDSYTFSISGNVVTVKSGTTTVASITVPDTSAGQTLAFADGSANLKITALNTATLGGAAIPTSFGHVNAELNHGDPSEPAADGNVFTLQEIAEHHEPGEQVLMWGYDVDGGGIPAEDLLNFLTNIAGLDFKELGLIDADGVDPASALSFITNITIGDLNLSDIETRDITITTKDGQVISAEAALGADYLEFLGDLLFDEEGNSRLFLEEKHDDNHDEDDNDFIRLTPSENNGGTVESGFTTSGDDLIVAGRTELLHGAYIDGGGGYNTLEVDMKGVFAQPLQLLNIQEIHVENLPNIYTESDDGYDTASYGHGGHHDDNSTYPDLSDGTYQTDSVLDLSRAIDLERLVITEGGELIDDYGDGDDPTTIELGELTILGVRNNATTRLEGGFTQDVTVNYGQGVGPAVNLELQIGDNPCFDLKIAHNASVLNLLSDGYENTLQSGDFGGNLSRLNISGTGTLNIEDDLEGFRDGTSQNPAVVDAHENSGGVILTFDDQPFVKFIGSTGNDYFASYDSEEVTILGGNGNNEFVTDGSEIVNITSGTGNDVISSLCSDVVTIDADGGNNTIVASAEEINITTGDGNDHITVSGKDFKFDAGYDPSYDLADCAPGALLKIDVEGGYNTITLGRDIDWFWSGDERVATSGFGHDKIELGVTALEGSSIIGTNITLFVENDSDLTQVDFSNAAVDSVVLKGELTLTDSQFAELGADVFVAEHAAFGNTGELHIVVTEDVTLGDLVDLSALSPSVKLSFDILDDATLTLTAEQLHLYVAEDGIDVSKGPNGNVVLTDVGLDFDPFDDEAGGGSLYAEDHRYDDLDIIRTVDGFERPTPDHATDTLTINSDDTPLITESIESDLKTLIIEGSSTLEFAQGVTVELAEKDHGHRWDVDSFGGYDHQRGFTVDFSALQGELLGLTLENFEDVKEMIGNYSGARINVELEGDVGRPGLENGLKTIGVAQYVVTDLNGEDRTFYTCDDTQGVQVLGLQGNSGYTLTFAGVPWGSTRPTLLMEGDGYANFDEGSKADANPDESNIGTLRAEFFYEGAPAVVHITNQGELLGQTSTGEDRPLVVEGIELVNAASVTINIDDGDAQILSIDGNQQLEDVIVTSDYDVDLHLDAPDSSFETIDANDVRGNMTLVIENEFGTVDLSETQLISVDAIVLEDDATLTLTMDQIADIGTEYITLAEGADDATINIAGLGEQLFVAPELVEGINVGTVTIAAQECVTLDPGTDLTGVDALIVPEGTTLNLSAAQFQQLEDAGTIITLPDDDPDTDLPTVVNITGLTQADIDAGLDLSGVENPGTITLAEDVVLAPDTDLGGFGIQLAAGQMITLATDDQAHERVITGADDTTVKFAFSEFDTVVNFDIGPLFGIDTSNYTDVTTLQVLTWLVENTNLERVLANLSETTTIEIVMPTEEDNIVNQIHRVVEVEEDTEVNGSLIFEDLNFNSEVVTLDLTLEGNVEINGDIDLGAITGIDESGFQTLTINSLGDEPNVIHGDLIGGFFSINNMLDVEINAQQDFTVDSIVFTSALEDDASAVLNIDGPGDVVIAEGLEVWDPFVDNLAITHTGTGDLTMRIDGDNFYVDGELSIAGSPDGTDTLIVANELDLSDAALSSIEAVVLENGADLTLTEAQALEIGLADIFVAEDGDAAVLNIEELGADPFLVTDLGDGIELGYVTIADTNDVVTLDPATDLTGADLIYVPEGTTLNLTAAQFQELEGAGTIIGGGTVNITDLTQADVDAGLDLSGILAEQGTITLGEDVVVLAPDTEISDFAIGVMTGQTLTLSSYEQANERDIYGDPGSTVVLGFTDLPVDPETGLYVDTIDTGDYDVPQLYVLDRLIETDDDGMGNNNVEQLLYHLRETVEVVIFEETQEEVPVNPEAVTAIHRVVYIEPGTTVEADVIFNDLDPDVELKTLDITMLGDATITGDLNVPAQDAPGFDQHFFETLTINSEGDDPNLIAGTIQGGYDIPDENNLRNVVINAEQDLTVGGIVYTSLDDDYLARLQVTTSNQADVTIGTIDTSDADIDRLEIVHNGDGLLTVTGASPALNMASAEEGDEELWLSGNGDMVFGTDATEETPANPGLYDPFLSLIDASGLTGDLDLGILDDIDSDDFTFKSGTGLTTLVVDDTLNAPPTPEEPTQWTFNMSNAAAGSELTFTDVTAFTNGGTLTVDAGANVTVTVSDAAIDNQDLVNDLQAISYLDVIDLTESGFVVLDQASALADTKLSENGTVYVVDSEIDTTAEVEALVAKDYVDYVDLQGASIVLDVDAFAAADAKLINAQVSIVDSGAEIATLTPEEFASSNLVFLDATDDAVTLTAEQYQAMETNPNAVFDDSDIVNITSGEGPDELDLINGGAATRINFTAETLGDVIENFNVFAPDMIRYSTLTDEAKTFELVNDPLADITDDANVIVFGTLTGISDIDTAAATVAADAEVTGEAGLIIFTDGTSTYVYATDNLNDNGEETLVATLVGVDPDFLTTGNFAI